MDDRDQVPPVPPTDVVGVETPVDDGNEAERSYKSYEEAARQGVLYILTGKLDSKLGDKQTPPAFTLYRYLSKANQPPWINKKTVGKSSTLCCRSHLMISASGLGFKKTPTSEPVDFMRLDYDPKKGFHFNIQALTDDRTAIDYNKKKLAAEFPSSAKDPDKYFQTLVEPLDRKRPTNPNEYELDPMSIWEIWKSGRRPHLVEESE